MTARRLRAVLLCAAAIPLTAAVAAAGLKVGHLRLCADRHGIEITARPRPNCPRCHGQGGWWTGGPFPEMDACGCWSHRRELRIPLRRRSAPYDEPPF